MSLRALGGGELIGEKLVRLVYVDEAGIGNPKQEPWLVVGAALVDADKKLVQLRAELDKIVERLVPAKGRDGFVIHAKELFHGGKQVPRNDPEWPLPLRMDIVEAVCKLPRKLQLPICFGFVRREGFPSTFTPYPPLSAREAARDAHVVAYMRCAMQVDLWMRDNTQNEHCMMIVEDNEEARTLMRETQAYYQDKTLVGLTPIEKKLLPLRRIQEYPLFQQKRPSSALQLADVCAYVFKRYLMNPDDQRNARFWEPMQPLAVYPREALSSE